MAALSTTPGTWYGLQADCDLWQGKRRFSAKIRQVGKGLPTCNS